jgi:hypothetical protein
MLLVLAQAVQVPQSGITTTLLSVAAAILSGVGTNYVMTIKTLERLDATTITKFAAIDKDLARHEKTNNDQWTKINVIDKEVAEIRTNCNNKHTNGKYSAHHG